MMYGQAVSLVGSWIGLNVALRVYNMQVRTILDQDCRGHLGPHMLVTFAAGGIREAIAWLVANYARQQTERKKCCRYFLVVSSSVKVTD